MLPLILVAVGAYLIGDSVLGDKKYDKGGMSDGGEKAVKKRLEELRKELRAEKISYGELAELESLKEYIDDDDIELRQAAGIPEFEDDDDDDDKYAKGGKLEVGDMVMVDDSGYAKYFSGFDVSKPAKITSKNKGKSFGKVKYFYGLETADGKKPFNQAIESMLTKVSKDGGMMAHGGKTQGYDDKEDERLAMEHGKMSKKDLDSKHARRDDARFEERGKMEHGVDVPHKYFITYSSLKNGFDLYSTSGDINDEKLIGNFSKIEEANKVAKDKGLERLPIYMRMAKGGKLVGKQKNLDVNKNGKLDAEDFKMLRGDKMADGGMMDVVNTEVIKVKGNIMGTTSLELKIKGMRKPQDFIVYPISAEEAGKPITIQSDTRFGYLDLSSGRGLMSQSHANGAYGYHFASDKKVPFKISETDVQKIKEHLSSKASSKAGNSVIFSDNSGADKMANGGFLRVTIENQDENLHQIAKYMVRAIKKRADFKDLVVYFEKDNDYDYKYRVKIFDEMNVYEMKKTEENIYKVLKAIVEANEAKK